MKSPRNAYAYSRAARPASARRARLRDSDQHRRIVLEPYRADGDEMLRVATHRTATIVRVV
jgi:hypothetical protein